MYYNNISIAFRKTFYFRDIIFRSSIDSRQIKEFSLSSYPEETTHYELYRRVNLFFFHASILRYLSLSVDEKSRVKMCENWRGYLRWRFHRIFSSRPPIMRAIIGWLFPISTRWNFHEITKHYDDQQRKILFPHIDFRRFPFFFFLSLFFHDSSFSLSLSFSLLPRQLWQRYQRRQR